MKTVSLKFDLFPLLARLDTCEEAHSLRVPKPDLKRGAMQLAPASSHASPTSRTPKRRVHVGDVILGCHLSVVIPEGIRRLRGRSTPAPLPARM